MHLVKTTTTTTTTTTTNINDNKNRPTNAGKIVSEAMQDEVFVC